MAATAAQYGSVGHRMITAAQTLNPTTSPEQIVARKAGLFFTMTPSFLCFDLPGFTAS
jgi:hypothetical protein